MQFHNTKTHQILLFAVLLTAVAVVAYLAGSARVRSDFRDRPLLQHSLEKRAGGIAGVWGSTRVFYTTYCGSSCLGFEVTNLTTGEIWKGVISFMSDDEGREYTLFDDWKGGEYRFDGEFISVRGREHGEKLILDFVVEDEKTSESVIHSVEF
ncbi:MAG: hypothetical protein G01um101417_666 [Parcubacteria group bacterium Gr01-1014_17]|nr:MAG: hypothetical protein G01um101417_666 [Parcubacteria group bacterium Gr01-1014_17]